MIGSRITTRADFHGLDPERHEVIQHQVQFFIDRNMTVKTPTFITAV